MNPNERRIQMEIKNYNQYHNFLGIENMHEFG